jgi:hypothetical protein
MFQNNLFTLNTRTRTRAAESQILRRMLHGMLHDACCMTRKRARLTNNSAREGYVIISIQIMIQIRLTEIFDNKKIKIFKIKSLKSVRVVDLTVKTFQNNFFKPNTRTGCMTGKRALPLTNNT